MGPAQHAFIIACCHVITSDYQGGTILILIFQVPSSQWKLLVFVFIFPDLVSQLFFIFLISHVLDLHSVNYRAFGDSWMEHFCQESVVEGEANSGNPTILIITSYALRCIHLLRFVSLSPSIPNSFCIPKP